MLLLKKKWKNKREEERLSALQSHIIRNLAEAASMGQDRNETIWPNDRLHNVYHMPQTRRVGWKGEEMVLKIAIVLI